jgi:hypothetical protein
MRLDADDIEAVAVRVAELVRDQTQTAGYVDAAELARSLGVDRDWVYRRWRSLGGVKLGTASNAPVRFDRARGALRRRSRRRVSASNPHRDEITSPGASDGSERVA